MKKNYYISDYHFCHQLARQRSRSQFATVEEMNEKMIACHNEVVTSEDDVYILGDVIVCEPAELAEKMAQTVARLNGNLHLIVGNHDFKFRNEPEFLKYFVSVNDYLIIKDQKRWLQLSHFPLLLWHRKQKGAFHLYGHIHDETRTKEYEILQSQPHCYNVCVEVVNFYPQTLDQLIAQKQK